MGARTSPFADLRLLPRGRRAGLVLASATRAAGLLLVAAGVANAIAAATHGRVDGVAFATALAGGLLRGAAVAATAALSSRGAAALKDGLRRRLLTALIARGDARVGSGAVLATEGLDALDDHVGTTLPALVDAAVVPLLVAVAVLGLDPLSALVIAGTVWLVPVFMILIGLHTEERVARSADALARLADHLVELARGLPVLVGLGRLEEQAEALAAVSAEHARRSLRVLRTAFLSSLALELIGTVAVAVVAVVIGLRLLVGDLPLATGLTVLLLAPECFTPIRDVGAAFHQAQDGREAARRAQAAADDAEPVPLVAAEGLVIEQLTIRHGVAAPVVRGLSATVRRGELVLLAGASGSGKSSLLDAIAGRGARLDPGAVTGRIAAGPIAMLPQRPAFPTSTAEEELVTFGAAREDVRRLLAAAALPIDPATRVDRLSPGEARRLAFARVLARVEAGASVVLLDEPTAHLDAASAAVVLTAVDGLRGRAAMLVASHDPAVAALADRVVSLDGSAPPPVPSARQVPLAPSAPVADRPRQNGGIRALGTVVRPLAPRILLAVAVSATAAAFAVALLVLSGWLIARAAEEPSIALVTVAMVGVRFFGIGRGALRYTDRLVTHGAAFAVAGELRLHLWRGLAAAGPASRALLTPGATVQALVADTDRIRDLVPRTVVPLGAGVAVCGAAVVAAWLLHPAAMLPVGLLVVVGGLLAVIAALSAARGWAMTERLRAEALLRAGGLLAAADDVAANGVAAGTIALAADAAAAADLSDARLRRLVGVLRGLVPAAVPAGAVAVIAATAPAVAAGAMPGPVVGALALLPIALGPVLDDLVQAAVRAARLVPVARRMAPLLAAVPPDGAGNELDGVAEVALRDLAARHPGAVQPVLCGLTATVRQGERLVVTGPSGSGKSTLLAVLLRYLPADVGFATLDRRPLDTLSARSVRRRIAWAPQEATVLDSSVRGNLLLARARTDRADDAELRTVLDRVGLAPWLAASPLGLDTPVGPRGSFLSGGQRQRLAVARTLLARADVVLLDEPTAHLDREAADALLADLDAALSDRIQIVVTHDAEVVRDSDLVLDLATRTPAANARTAVGGTF